MTCFLGMDEQPFGSQGDAGALVFDANGEAVGMLSGVGQYDQLNSPPGISLVVSMEDISEGMEGLGLRDVKFANA